jgi:hypothetical protein
MLRLLVEIADAEKRLEANAARLAAKSHAAAAPGGDPKSGA